MAALRPVRALVCVMTNVDFTRLRFLVVDDNPHTRRILRTLLHGFGAREVHEAEDGASGLESYSAHLPDVVILDWVMPIFDGIELTQMIRQPDFIINPFVPIILLTAYTDRQRVIVARDAGVTEVLAKPISAKVLHQRIVAVLTRPRKFIRTDTYFGPEPRTEIKANFDAAMERRSAPHRPAVGAAA